MTRRSMYMFAQKMLPRRTSCMRQDPLAQCVRQRFFVLVSSSYAQRLITLSMCQDCGIHFGSLSMA